MLSVQSTPGTTKMTIETCWLFWLVVEFQPIWKICSSKWESSPNMGENKNIFETNTYFLMWMSCLSSQMLYKNECQQNIYYIPYIDPMGLVVGANFQHIIFLLDVADGWWYQKMASTSYTWSYTPANPYKWPCKWETGVVVPMIGVITLLTTI